MERAKVDVPLAALGALVDEDRVAAELPIAYLPRIPVGSSYREMIERAVGWGRR